MLIKWEVLSSLSGGLRSGKDSEEVMFPLRPEWTVPTPKQEGKALRTRTATRETIREQVGKKSCGLTLSWGFREEGRAQVG